jgi:hypothetical protein
MASQMRIAGILSIAGALGAQTDWPFYGHDAAGQPFLPVAKINAQNASKPKPVALCLRAIRVGEDKHVGFDWFAVFDS